MRPPRRLRLRPHRPRRPRPRSRLIPRRSSFVAVALAACAPLPPARPASKDRIAIIVSERGPHGVRLVALDEHGDRQLDVVEPALKVARDTHPSVSPDGAWIVFASSRDRTLDETSLWIAPLRPNAIATRLTSGASIEAYPIWTADSRAIVYASTREGTFDLYRQPIDRGRPVGVPERMTSAAGHEIAPSIAPDGTIFYTAV